MPYLCGMKTLTMVIIAMLAGATCKAQNVSGTVTDGHGPLCGANVWMEGTLDGCLTDSLGRFAFDTPETDSMTLCATYIGFKPLRATIRKGLTQHIVLRMKEEPLDLKEVVVTGSSFRFGNTGETRSMSSLDVVMEGNSCGDVVAAMQMLPGTQKAGEDGKLYVRGGSSDECQTFINGMHVLEPYTVHSSNDAVRGRFSPFLFKGMNFSLGGYSAEYGQALSAVLPMETTDRQTSDKLGISASLLDWNAGGTKVLGRSSLSFNLAYTNLRPYYHLFHSSLDWSHPYENVSGETQYKVDLGEQWQWKTYLGYDYTTLGIDNYDNRAFRLREQNLYANTTMRGTLSNDWVLFFGTAASGVFRRMDGALTGHDQYSRDHYEIHLKATAKKYIGRSWNVMAGMEDYIRKNQLRYVATAGTHYQLHYQVPAVFADAQARIVGPLFVRMSARAEANTFDHNWALMPRLSLSYVPSAQFQISIIGGRYSQMPEDDYVAQYDKSQHEDLKAQSTADHAIASMQYKKNNTTVRLEAYCKRYRHLPLAAGNGFCDNGHGTSRGLDFFVENQWMGNRLFTRMSYSYNDSKRFYLDYTEEHAPEYSSRHNVRLSARYYVFDKLSFSLAGSYASHRWSEGRKTPAYNSLDASATWLAHKRMIVYASCSNLLGRRNVYGYQNGTPIVNSSRRTFYIGVFISIKSNKAYDISNF